MRILPLFIALIAITKVSGQECLALLDSATAKQLHDQEKTLVLLEKLNSNLESGKCDVQIGYPEVYHNMGLIYGNLKDRRSAIQYLNQSVTLKLEEVDSLSTDMLRFYDNIFSIYRQYGKYSEAEVYLRLAERIFENNLEKDISYLSHLLRSGIYFRDISSFSQSAERFAKALKVAEEQLLVNDSIKGTILIEIGTLYTTMGNYPSATENLERAIAILRTDYPELHSRAIDRLGRLKMESGEITYSESSLLSNISFKKSQFPKDTLLLVESLNNLGVLYFRINDFPKAEFYFNELVKIGQKNSTVLPYGLNNLGTIFLRANKVDQAVESFDQAADVFSEMYGTLHQDYANVLNNLAGALNKQGDYEQAISMYNQVLDIDKALFGSSHPKYATSLTNLALTYAKLGYTDLARKFLEQSTVIKEKSLGHHHFEVAKSYDDLGLIHLALGDTLLALQSLDTALAINLKHIQNIFPVLTNAQRTLAYNQIRFNQQRFSSLAFSEKYFHSSWGEKALNYSINTKSILYYASDKMRKLTQESEDPETTNLYVTWRKRGLELANAYLMQDYELVAQGISLEKLEEECHNLEKQLAQKVSAHSFGDEAIFETWQDISAALPDSAALVEILQFQPYELRIDSAEFRQGFRGESHFVGFIVKPDGLLEKVRWDADTNFKDQFTFYRNSLKYGLADSKSYLSLWSPIDDHLTGIKKIYFAGDGGWHKINPSIFYDAKKAEYVADKYHVLNITSGKDLVRENANTWNRTAQMIGNPDFGEANKDLKQLPGAEEEVEEVSKILKKDKWKVSSFFGAKATKETLNGVSHPGILHIATHGFFNQDDLSDPLLNSGLYLASNEEVGGKLTAYEAMNLVLDETLLVVLSACETGLGEIKNGEGVFGLQRALLTAGAENLIFTLVKVNDQATREFMNLFYENFTQEENVESAFFKARNKFKETHPAPLDWGAFLLATKH